MRVELGRVARVAARPRGRRALLHRRRQLRRGRCGQARAGRLHRRARSARRRARAHAPHRRHGGRRGGRRRGRPGLRAGAARYAPRTAGTRPPTMSERKRGLSTKAIHTPPLPTGPGEPVVGPIVASTTFAFEQVADLARVIAEEEYGFSYARLRNPTVEELNAVMAELENAEAAQCFGSGMAAISAALHSTLAPGDTLLLPQQLYGTTYDLAEKQLRPRGVEVEYLDVTDAAAWERPARVRFVETMANPGFPLADLGAIAATKGDGLLIVDNTFASPALCRPLEHGADIVCESATKYLNGHHDVTAGVLAGSKELVAAARAHQISVGSILDPFPAFLVRRGLKTLTLRMERASANALAVGRFLEGHEKVAHVLYA